VTAFTLAPGSGFSVQSAADLDRYMGAVSDAGFQGVSLSLEHAEPYLDQVPGLLARHHLQCPEVLAMRVTRDEDETLGPARRLARLSESLEAEFALSLFFTRVNEESIDRFGRCADLIRAAGAKLVLEMPPIGPLNSITAALEVIDAVGRDRCALLVDTFHFSRGTSTWDQLENLPLDALGYIQFDDALPAIGEDVMYETTERRTMPGDGEFELSRFCGVLIDRGWSGWVSVEVLSAELRQLEVEDFAARAYRTSEPFWSGSSDHPSRVSTL